MSLATASKYSDRRVKAVTINEIPISLSPGAILCEDAPWGCQKPFVTSNVSYTPEPVRVQVMMGQSYVPFMAWVYSHASVESSGSPRGFGMEIC